MAKKTEENNQGLESLPQEVIKEVLKEQKDFRDDIFDYELSETLDEFSQPLKMKEKKELKKYDLQNVDAEKDFDGLIMDLAKLRGVSNDIIDAQEYSELSIWVRKVCYGTFDLRRAAKK